MLIAGVLPVFLAEVALADMENAFRVPDWASGADLESQRLELYRQHMSCTTSATERMLSSDEAAACSRAFLGLKLSFLPGSDIERFRTLSPAARASGNAKGYDAYRAWLHRQVVTAPLDPGRDQSESAD